jgi:hypothetical protein
MRLRKLASAAAFLATAAPAAAQTPAPVATPTPNISVFAPTAEESCGAQQRLAGLTTPAPQSRFWVSTDYVLWFVQTVNVPELIQAVPTATAASQAVITGADRLFPGQRELYFGGASGVRAQAGFRISDNWSADAGGFVLESRAVGGEGGGDGSLNSLGVGRPYTQVGTGTPILLYTNLPGSYAGSVQAFANTQLWGIDANLRRDTYRLLMADRAELLGGLRYIDLQESITIRDTFRLNDGGTLAVEDVFKTKNQFYGSHGGFAAQWDSNKWHLDLTTKFGLGFVNQRVESFGSNTFVSPTGAVDSEAVGLYSRPFNQGTFERDKAAFMGELNLNVGYNITPQIRANIGYSIIYLSSVMRAGEAIDPVLNDSRIRYVADPAPSDVNAPVFDWGRASDFWAQGINFGFTVRY